MILYYFVNHTHWEMIEVPHDTYEHIAERLRTVCRIFPKWDLMKDAISFYDTEQDMDRLMKCKDRGYEILTPSMASSRV